jgi:rod shape-determining protein MreD
MRRFIFYLFLGIIFLTLQSTLLASLHIQRIRPDLVLILTLYLGLFYSPVSGGILALFLGFLMDLFSGNSFGLYTLSRPFIFYIAQFSRGRFYLESYRSQFFFIFVLSLVEGLLIFLILEVLNPVPSGHLYLLLFHFLLPQSFLTGLLTPIFFTLIHIGFFSLVGRHGMEVMERG